MTYFCALFSKESKKLYNRYHAQASGGGAYKFADDFREKLGVCLDKLDEMDSVVSGANFLLQVSLSSLAAFVISYFTVRYSSASPYS